MMGPGAYRCLSSTIPSPCGVTRLIIPPSGSYLGLKEPESLASP